MSTQHGFILVQTVPIYHRIFSNQDICARDVHFYRLVLISLVQQVTVACPKFLTMRYMIAIIVSAKAVWVLNTSLSFELTNMGILKHDTRWVYPEALAVHLYCFDYYTELVNNTFKMITVGIFESTYGTWKGEMYKNDIV